MKREENLRNWSKGDPFIVAECLATLFPTITRKVEDVPTEFCDVAKISSRSVRGTTCFYPAA